MKAEKSHSERRPDKQNHVGWGTSSDGTPGPLTALRTQQQSPQGHPACHSHEPPAIHTFLCLALYIFCIYVCISCPFRKHSTYGICTCLMKTGTSCFHSYPELFPLHLPLKSLEIRGTNLKLKDPNFREAFLSPSLTPPRWTILLHPLK